MAAPVPVERRARWAISFADLALLLLGFFVLLQASGQKSRAVLAGVSAQFAPPDRAAITLKATDIFVPDEAMLSPAGAARVAALGRHFADGGAVELMSSGQGRATRRFDSWDLAAARLGAVARTLRASGIAPEKLVIRGLDERADTNAGQVIRIGPGRVAR